MKSIKKILSLAVVMMLMVAATVFGADATSITAPDNGHTYEAYQIFTGTLSDGVLSNVQAGANAKSGIDVDEALTAITGVASSSETAKLAVIEQYVNLTGTAFKTIAANATEEVPAGYYLIKDVDNSQQATQEAYTLYIVKVVGEVTISPKAGTPTVVKKVKDTNDTTGVTTEWQDTADYDIGDDVPFKLTASIPAEYSTYKDYYLSFNDTLSAGLTLNASSIVVKVDGETVDGSKYYIYGDQNTFKVVIYDLKDIKATGAENVTVEYTAKLNAGANIGSTGNPNVVDLTFSNNPNVEGVGAPAGDTPGTPETPENPENPETPDAPKNPGTPGTPDDTGKTPEDKVIVFTYKVVVNKVNSSNEALVGASFKLEKKNADGTWKNLGEIDGASLSTFEWNGIDDGDYKITETKTPNGYNSIDPIEFTVSATHIDDAAPEGKTPLTLDKLSGGDEFTGTVSTGAVTKNVTNVKGSELPSTGGIGTTIFYVVGGSLMILALCLLVFKKKNNIEE